MREMDERPIARVASSELLLPHLRVRSTFHADLLRPVRLNRRRTSGHPGGPPPAAAACRKRRKHAKELRVIEESPPNNSEGPQNNPRASCFRRDGSLPSQCPEIRTGRSRDLRVRSQEMKGHHPQAVVIPSLRLTRSSSSTRHIRPDSCTSFTKSRDPQHHIPEPEASDPGPRWLVAKTTGESGAYHDGENRKVVRNKRVPGVHTHVITGHPPGLSSVTERSQSREGILRFHPATRQDLIRQDRRKGFQTQQEMNTIPDSQQTLKSFGGHKIVDPNSSQIPLDTNFSRPSPVHIQAGKSVAIRQEDTRSLRSKNGRTPDNVEPSLPTTPERTPPKDSPHSSINRNSSDIDRAIRPRSHVNTTRHHVSLCMCELCRRARSRRAPGPPPPPTFKIVGSEPRLVSATLLAHGFKKQGRRRAARGDWRLLWSSQHLRHHLFRNLNHNQRVNSFPRTYECTRKDALARNMNRMRQIHGEKHFSFAPRAFVLPASKLDTNAVSRVKPPRHGLISEREAIREAMAGSDGAWIVKPASSACGRGIFITKNFADLPEGERLEGNWIVQSYVEDPLLMDGLKFDLRLYVAVTSFCPLRVYLHEEGLCRLATEPYSSEVRSFGNRFVHLTNYSINRKSSRYEPGITTGLGVDGKEAKCNNACPEGSELAGSKKTVLTETSLSSVPPLRQAATMATNLIDTSSVEHTATSLENDAATRFDIPEPVRGGASREGDVAGGFKPSSRDHGRSEFHQRIKSTSEGCDRDFTSSMPQDDVEKGGRGSKWSLTALRKRLAWMGFDVPTLWEEIHELVIKTLIAIEGQVSAAVELMGIHRGVCFEMFGFDVLVDRKLKPYLLEVNFAPSLNTSSDLDLSVKSRVVADLLTLAGIRGAYGPKNVGAQFGRRVGRQVTRNGDRSSGAAGSEGEAIDGERMRTRQTERGRLVKNTAAIVSITAEGEDTETPIDGVDAPAFKAASDSDGNACVKRVTNAERRDEAGRAGRRRRSRRTRRKNAGLSGEPGGSRRIAPAWDGHCGGGDSGLSSLEVSAVAAESARELRRSGGFRLIFPVRETAQKYFKFFDGPRPLERMLATAREEEASQSKGFSKNGRNSRRD